MATVRRELAGADLDELVDLLRTLIRIPTVNPPGDEILAARYLEGVLGDAGVPSTVVEPFPGRGSIVARLRGDGTGGEPLLLLSHLDVVPAAAENWTHDPFGGDLAGGYVWGRGAVDMKAMVAMEVQVIRRLAAAARAAGRDPASDPVPGLRRDVIFASTADEEAGGWQGASWLVDEHPDWLRAAGALNEAGGVAITFAGSRFYPIQVAEKGFVVYHLTVRGRWGHGSVPTDENAAVLAARVVTRLAEPGPARLTPVLAAALVAVLPHLPPEVLAQLAAPGRPRVARAVAAAGRGLRPAIRRMPPRLARRLVARAAREPDRLDAALHALCEPTYARTGSALLHDTISPDIVSAGVKYNVIPGVAEITLDCRILPGMDEPKMTAELRRRIGEDLVERVEIEVEQVGKPVQAPLDTALYPLLERVLRDHDRAAVPVPVIVPFATDAKHLSRIGVPCYGFSPLKMGDEDNFLRLMHGDDERVSLQALRFGLPVLEDAVLRFCG